MLKLKKKKFQSHKIILKITNQRKKIKNIITIIINN
jgi:hypothetical protein